MFAPYSPAFASEPGTPSVLVRVGLGVAGVAALLVLVASGEPDEHALSHKIKKPISAIMPRDLEFHRSRRCSVNSAFIIFLPLFSFNSARLYPFPFCSFAADRLYFGSVLDRRIKLAAALRRQVQH